MAKIERLNKTIIPQLSDPGNVGRQANPQLLAEAGGIARGVGVLAEQELGKQQELQALQDQTDLVRRSSEFQNQAFDLTAQNRETFKSDPNKGVDELEIGLRELSKGFTQGLSPRNLALFNRSQEQAIGRATLQERGVAAQQIQTNTQNNITSTGKEYLNSARLAGQNADFQRIDNIAQDVSVLTAQAAGSLDAKSFGTFAQNLEDGIVENFADSLMENHTDLFIEKLNEGFFDEFLDEGEIQDKLGEAQKFLKTKNEQAAFGRSLNFLRNNSDIASKVDKGEFSFSDVDDLMAAGEISPEFAEAKRKEIINGKAKVVTDPIEYGNIKAKVDRLLEDKEVPDSLGAALDLQQEIANLQAEGKLKASDGNTLTRTVQIGISNTVALDGVTNSLSINHYKEASDAFEQQGLEGAELLNALREYSIETDRTGVDELNSQLLDAQPSTLSKILPGSTQATVDKKIKSEDLSGQIEKLSKANRDSVLKRILRSNNPSLNAFQGDLPNNVISGGVASKGLPGGDVKPDVSVSLPQEQSFDTVEELNAARLPVGTLVIVNGVKGRVTQ